MDWVTVVSRCPIDITVVDSSKTTSNKPAIVYRVPVLLSSSGLRTQTRGMDREKKPKKGKAKDSSRSTSSSSSSKAKDGSGRSERMIRKQRYVDDDDFSVAPSMDQDVKSVVSVSFDDVYQRGRKLGLGAFA
eukprot:scaffold344_cov130-Cylindrotheca_fusiformis.AAC.1